MDSTPWSNQLKEEQNMNMYNIIIILLLCGLLAVALIGFIIMLFMHKKEKKDVSQEHYNYRLHNVSRIVYFIALLASTIVPTFWLFNFGVYFIFLTLLYASPFFVFLIQNIMAHRLIDHNISLHFIALCAAILSVALVIHESDVFYLMEGILISLPIICYILFIGFYLFVGFYAFFAWMAALSYRNK